MFLVSFDELLFFSFDHLVTKNQILNINRQPKFFVIVSIRKEKMLDGSLSIQIKMTTEISTDICCLSMYLVFRYQLTL